MAKPLIKSDRIWENYRNLLKLNESPIKESPSLLVSVLQFLPRTDSF